MRVLFVAVVSLVASYVGPALSFSTGAPREACTTATPNHPATPQSITNPYTIDLSDVFDDGGGGFTYLPGRSYQLTLSAAANSPTFRGFLIQGRLVADDSPVGAFVEPPAGSGARLSSCNISNVAITHNSATDKSSITVSWIAPSNGTGAVRFVYAVVQTYLIFWANDTTSTIQEGSSCEVPFYESNGVCVETCPENEFGNHTSGQCELYATGFNAAFNATTYVAEITADTPFGTPVLYFSAVIGNQDFINIFLTLVENDLVERVFRFYPSGALSQTFILTPNSSSNTIVTQIQYVDDPRNVRPGSDPVTLPATYGMNINLAALNPSTATIVDRSVRAFVTVNPPPDPCQPNPCTNERTCNAQSTTNYTCTCPPDFTGTNCEVQIDDCVGVDCGNGTCVDGVESFQCMCLAGFTGPSCEINIDECQTTECVNGECTDLINEVECECYPGWTGAQCDVDIDYCQPQPFGPCNTTGSVGCNDGNTTYTCDCLIGFTGSNCSQDIDECESIPAMTGEPACFNDGNCTNLLFGRFECNCPSDYLGDRCEIDITPCDPSPCENGGTCEQNGLNFMCNCPPGYTGSNCSIEINECMSDPCDNGGTCVDAVNGFICHCPIGYTGAMCDVDEKFCTNETCQNNGTCMEGPGIETMCMCAESFSGSNCSTDLSFCTPTTCMNGGTCTEGRGTMISCYCPTGFTGMLCETDPPDCRLNTCDNGGTCVEEYGPATRCICAEGFTGTRCDIDLPFCEVDTCLNSGTCNDGVGTVTTCDCMDGFTGANCSVDLDYCTPETCLNGGTCDEGPGTLTTCDCAAGFAGDNCSVDLPFCQPDTCLNNGTCLEDVGTLTRCECALGFAGMRCGEDDENYTACEPATCMNGGTCGEEFGPETSCTCPEGYTGPDCGIDLPFCTPETCLNNGTCNEGPGTETTCSCDPGFSGSNCSVDLDFCTPDTCYNNGTCIEGLGNGTNCSCHEGFTGTACETDLPFCEEETCLNGGTCFEGLGTETICECVPGFSGPQCESDLSFCQADSCLNGGTCIEEAGEQTRCVCVPDFTGPDCSQYNTPETTTALFQLRLKPVRECVTWVDERRAQKFVDIVSAVVQQVQMRCSCNFTETNIQNYEFSCRSIENTVVFRAEIIYTSLQQAKYRAENLVTLVSEWVQSETSIAVDSTRLDVDPTCPTQLRSFQDGDCVLTDTTGTGGGNVATFASLGVVAGVVCVLLIICTIIIVIFVVQRKKKHRTFSPADETYELPQLPTDDSTVKANPARSENVITSSNAAYGDFQIPRQEYDTKEEEKGKRWNKRNQGTFSPADETNEIPANETNEIPELPLQISRQENDTKEDEGEDHTYEPLPFDTPRQ